jgi:glycerophosphoryl diester phosphodiesterase
MNRSILSIAHRGAAGITPENTKIAFLKALDLGADAIEFDVQLTQDDVCIVFHDESLERTTNGDGLVADTSWEVISKLDAGSWFAASFRNVEVPTLEEVLKTIGGRTTLNIELKPDKRRQEKLVRHVITAVARFDLFESVVFSSFDLGSVELLARLVPKARVGVLCLPDRVEKAVAAAVRMKAETIHPHVGMVDQEFVNDAHARGWNVWAWTANEPGEIELLMALGVDGIFTDYPDRVVNPRKRRD